MVLPENVSDVFDTARGVADHPAVAVEPVVREALMHVVTTMTPAILERIAELGHAGTGCEANAARAAEGAKLRVLTVDMWQALGLTMAGVSSTDERQGVNDMTEPDESAAETETEAVEADDAEAGAEAAADADGE